MKTTSLVILLGLLGLTGCSSMMSGLDASSSFACKAPEGVSCQSISGTYYNSVADNLPAQKKNSAGNEKQGTDSDKTAKTTAVKPDDGRKYLSPRDMESMSSGVPIRQAPMVLRVWIAPWEDEEGVLHDQSHLYAVVHSGKWMIETNRSNIRQQFRPVFPLNKKASAAAEDRTNANPANGPLVTPNNYDGTVRPGNYGQVDR